MTDVGKVQYHERLKEIPFLRDSTQLHSIPDDQLELEFQFNITMNNLIPVAVLVFVLVFVLIFILLLVFSQLHIPSHHDTIKSTSK